MIILYVHNSTNIWTQSPEDTKSSSSNSSKASNSNEVIGVKEKNESLRERTSVLCPSYRTKYSQDGIISCIVDFPSDICGTRIELYLEMWINQNQLLQSTKKEAFVDCNSPPIVIDR